jgi:hypothetical protein
LAKPAQEPVECLDCGSHNVGIPATYDSLVDSVKAQTDHEPVKLWVARQIAAEYVLPNSQMDSGALYYALMQCLEFVDDQQAPKSNPTLREQFETNSLWSKLKSECDVTSLDGRAQFVTQAKDLWRTLPNGKLKRQILIETAELVQIRQNDLATLWGYPEPNFRRN